MTALLVRTTGSVSVNNADLFGFVLSPAGLAIVLAAGAAALAIHAVESGGFLVLLAREEAAGERALLPALRALGAAGWRLALLALLQVVGLALVALPFLALLGAIYRFLLGAHDVNYYLAERPREFWVAAASAAVVALLVTALLARLWVSWSLALPILLAEGLAPRAALAESRRRLRGALGRAALLLLGWALLLWVLAGLALGLYDRFARGLLGVLPEREGLLLPVVAALLALQTLALAAVAIAATSGHAPLVHRLHVERGGRPLAAPDAGRAGARRGVSLGLAALGFGLLALALGVGLASATDLERPVLVMAHRGASLAAPENTLAAIQESIEAGADYAEIDVQRTKDGELVLNHDADLMRVGGAPLRITQATLAEIRAVDVGRRFSPDFAGERVPTLREAIELARGRIRLNIELKFYGKERELAGDVARLVAETGFEAECVVTSLEIDGVLEARRQDPRLSIGLIASASVGRLVQSDVDLFAVSRGIATDAFLREAHRLDKQVVVWTVDDRATMLALIDQGVDGILTNDPALLERVIRERSELQDWQRLLLVAHDSFAR